jgi:arsenate reductase
VFPNAQNRLHWSIPDPSKATGMEAQLDAYRSVRDELKKRIEEELLV